MRSLGVNLSLWLTTAQPGTFEDMTCASGTPTAWTHGRHDSGPIAVAAVQTAVIGLARSDGVRHGKCRVGEESSLRWVFGYLQGLSRLGVFGSTGSIAVKGALNR